MAGDCVKDVVAFPPEGLMATPAMAAQVPLAAVQLKVVELDVATAELPAPRVSFKKAFHRCVCDVVNDDEAFLLETTPMTRSPAADGTLMEILLAFVTAVAGVPVGLV